MDTDKDESVKKDEKGPAVCVGGRSGRTLARLGVVRVRSFCSRRQGDRLTLDAILLDVEATDGNGGRLVLLIDRSNCSKNHTHILNHMST